MSEFIFWGIFLLIIGIGMAFVVKYSKPRKLSKGRIAFYKDELIKCDNYSNSEKIIKYDKILNHILKDCGIKGNLGDQLKKKPTIIKDIQEIWRLHKIRNIIAHDLTGMSEVKLEIDAIKYKKELNKLLNN
ncbi:hypothetical protein M0P65_03335 [Candidatus Gracilibacteria bacterium]|nr:hypothetical protein [Candidatus Gracilibacteria bacterium]